MLRIFPLAVIDFEASSLGSDSYPIEVGVAIATGRQADIASWSALIKPSPEWKSANAWDRRSEQVHGIRQSQLDEGLQPAEALARLNELLTPIGTVWCDGGQYDRFWFDRLCKAAPLVRPAFKLWDIVGLFALDRAAHNRFANHIAQTEAPHRAGPDAVRICKAIVTSLEDRKD